MRRSLVAAALLAAGCRGTVPERNGAPEQAISAILIGGRMVLPTGESKDGLATLDFESDGGRRAEVYRLPVAAGETYLSRVEPGTYRLAPARGFFGYHQPEMRVVIDGRTYRLPFPREILRLSPYTVKPGKILPLGVLEATVMKALPGQAPQIRVRLDDGLQARRSVVQAMVRGMMDSTVNRDARESAVAWSRQLQASLLDILSEEQKPALYTPRAP